MDKKKLIRWKVYFDRSRMYIGYVQFFLIALVFIKSLDPNPITKFVADHAIISIPGLLVLFVILSLVVGYLDSRLGLREEEIRNFAQSNPVLKKIQESLDSLHSEVKELREQRTTASRKIPEVRPDDS